MSSDALEKEDRSVGQGVRKVPCEVYSRIVGYLRPIQAWNKGKQQEFRERKTYVVVEPEASDAQE